MALTRLRKIQRELCCVPTCENGPSDAHRQWARVSQEHICDLRTMASNGFRHRHGDRLTTVWMALWALTGAVLVAWLMLTHHSDDPSSMGVALLAVTFLALMGGLVGMVVGGLLALFVVTVLDALLGNPELVLRELRPLNEMGGECERLLRLLEHPSVLAYRNEVVAAGRELVARDQRILEGLARYDRQRPQQLRHEQACRQLHGLEPLPAREDDTAGETQVSA